MSYHVIDVSEEGVTLSVKNRQFICRGKDGSIKSLPLEDVGAVMINSFSALLHDSFICGAADAGVAVVVCERFKPKAVILGVQRGGDTLLTRAQIRATERFQNGIWQKIIKAKVANQYSLLEGLGADARSLEMFRVSMGREDASMEGNCARIYWSAYGRLLGNTPFKRQQEGDGINALLNYGYGVLLSRILQKLLAFGLDPMYGVGHAVRERAMALAYDIMEPFRPAVDNEVFKVVRERTRLNIALTIDRPSKVALQNVMNSRHPIIGRGKNKLDSIVDLTIKSLRSAYLHEKIGDFSPWIRRSSKWDG